MKKDSETAKDRILLASRKEFLEKGFDKTRMDDIAQRAGLTKMMLYYYFDSKENILKELISQILSLAKENFTKGFDVMRKLKFVKPEFLLKRIEKVLGKNRDVVKLVTIEVIKGTVAISEVVELFKSFFDTLIESVEKAEGKIEEPNDLFIKVFFFQTVPLMLYFSISDEIIRTFGMDEKRAMRVFMDKFAKTIFSTLNEQGIPIEYK